MVSCINIYLSLYIYIYIDQILKNPLTVPWSLFGKKDPVLRGLKMYFYRGVSVIS